MKTIYQLMFQLNTHAQYSYKIGKCYLKQSFKDNLLNSTKNKKMQRRLSQHVAINSLIHYFINKRKK